MEGAGGVGALLVVTNDSENYYPSYDGNSNIVNYMDETQTSVAKFEYTPFGAIKSENGSLSDQFHYRFSTKYFDNSTGLIVYRYRNYNPETGKWQTRDPISENGGYNLYYFVGNNPIVYIDELGLKEYQPVDVPSISSASENPYAYHKGSPKGILTFGGTMQQIIRYKTLFLDIETIANKVFNMEWSLKIPYECKCVMENGKSYIALDTIPLDEKNFKSFTNVEDKDVSASAAIGSINYHGKHHINIQARTQYRHEENSLKNESLLDVTVTAKWVRKSFWDFSAGFFGGGMTFQKKVLESSKLIATQKILYTLGCKKNTNGKYEVFKHKKQILNYGHTDLVDLTK